MAESKKKAKYRPDDFQEGLILAHIPPQLLHLNLNFRFFLFSLFDFFRVFWLVELCGPCDVTFFPLKTKNV